MKNIRRANKSMIDLPEDQQRFMKIGEVAEQTGIAVETLRFYERSGLLDPPIRTESGYRLYNTNALEALEFIKRAQMLGFTLEEIKRIMNESRSNKSPCLDVRNIVRARLLELEEQLQQMQKYRDVLAETLKQWDKTGKSNGRYCGLIENTDLGDVTNSPRKLERKRK